MIVCDMCPDRTPASFRMTLETIDPERPYADAEEAEIAALARVIGLMPNVDYRNSVALCSDHAKTLSQDPEIGKVLLEDALRANRE